MKLVIQIPALNEEAILARAIAAVPRRVPGFSHVAILVVDDGSTDRTSEVARLSGADRVVRFASHRGLAAAFRVGLEEALEMGADVVVNFDADLQYDPNDISALVAPLLADRADIVVGDRSPGSLAHFSVTKRLLQRFGSWMVRQVSGLAIHDATSGFRAFSREAARRVNVFSKMTYTLETLIQAGFKNLRVTSVPVQAHPVKRASRLLASPTKYVVIQAANIVRITALYKPLKIFSGIAAAFWLVGAALGIRVIAAHWTGDLEPHPFALLLSALLIVIGVLVFLMALLADLMAINREFLEELKLREGEKLSAVSSPLSARGEKPAGSDERERTANR